MVEEGERGEERERGEREREIHISRKNCMLFKNLFITRKRNKSALKLLVIGFYILNHLEVGVFLKYHDFKVRIHLKISYLKSKIKVLKL